MSSKPESASKSSSQVIAEKELEAYQGVKNKNTKVGTFFLLKAPE